MSRGTLIDLLYLVAATTFVVALKGLSSPKHARRGNIIAAAGMLLAIVATFFKFVDGHALYHVPLILLGIGVGVIVAVPVARFVKMTAMPQLVAIFNGVGGGAAALVSITEFIHIHSTKPATYVILEVLLGVLIGTVSFSGSAIAFAKLQELMTGRPVTYPGQQLLNGVCRRRRAGRSSGRSWSPGPTSLAVDPAGALGFVLGVAFVLPIGGADVPVLISLLNSFTGLAVAASGFTLGSNLLIVAGTLVGASGILLTRLMSAAMGRSLPNILFSAFGSVVTASGATERDDGRSVRSGSARGHRRPAQLRQPRRHHPGLRAGGRPGPARGARARRGARGQGHRGVLRHPPGRRADARAHERAAGRGQRPLRVAQGDGRGELRAPDHRRRPRRGRQRHGQPGREGRADLADLRNADHPTPTWPRTSSSSSARCARASPGIENELLYNPKTVLLFGDAKDTLTKLLAVVKAS